MKSLRLQLQRNKNNSNTLPSAAAKLLTALIAVCCLTACSMGFGARKVVESRFDYNDALVRSHKEQLLLNLVRLRYFDVTSFLEVSSVVNQFSRTQRARATPFRLNLGTVDIPSAEIGADMDYSERPTITYTPLQGQQFTTRFLSPISPATLILLARSGWSIKRLLHCCVQEILYFKNYPSAAGPTPSIAKGSEDFVYLADLLRSLQRHGALAVSHRQRPTSHSSEILIEKSRSKEVERSSKELRTLLGLPADSSTFVIGPPGTSSSGHIVPVSTRSLLGVLFFLSQAVEVPEKHESQGIVNVTYDEQGERLDWYSAIGRILKVKVAKRKPKNPYASVYYRDHWFYIADEDLHSKATFGLLSYLLSLQSAGGVDGVPLLTLPAGN